MSLEGATVEGAMLHTAFLLCTRGIPQIYYGEELGMTGGEDPDNRRDFLGGWAGDKRNAFAQAGRTHEEQKMFEWAQKWIDLRRKNESLRAGKTVDLFYDNDVYIFARASNIPLSNVWLNQIVLAFNNSKSPKKVELSSLAVSKGDAPKFIDTTVHPKLVSMFDKNKFIEPNNGKYVLTLQPNSAIAFKVEYKTVDKQ
jgi:glycosidase